ncbi:hypothetical protein OUZ56_005224 [Daphnia magna]|uniref:Uncharacterized protein n=1 Tax=Daphnia magna TaxID=35525 RepID=A0ABQ9YS69_9CRUS|nr:hypothetical protein OUZ56_005224 [Daphnia magna]
MHLKREAQLLRRRETIHCYSAERPFFLLLFLVCPFVSWPPNAWLNQNRETFYILDLSDATVGTKVNVAIRREEFSFTSDPTGIYVALSYSCGKIEREIRNGSSYMGSPLAVEVGRRPSVRLASTDRWFDNVTDNSSRRVDSRCPVSVSLSVSDQ